jgi:hypothetical protein
MALCGKYTAVDTIGVDIYIRSYLSLPNMKSTWILINEQDLLLK